MEVIRRQSWFSRIGGAILGTLFGGVMVIASFPLLFWNEGRAVQTARALAEGAKQVASVAADAIDANHEGQLIHISGRAFSEQELQDEEFGVRVNAIRLNRTVEMYQWAEIEERKTRKRVGGARETIHTYRYEPKWSASLIRSEGFQERQGHENPTSMPLPSHQHQSQQVYVGAFQLPADLINQIERPEQLPIELAQIPPALAEQVRPGAPGELQWGQVAHAASPQVGDVRIRFTVTRPTDVSIVARQHGKQLEPFVTHNGRELQLLSLGVVSAEEMFREAAAQNRILTWVVRVAGSGLMFAGLALLLRPLSVLADVIPFAGTLVGAGTTLISFLTALSLSLFTISLGWLTYRPLIGVPTLLAALGFGYLLVRRLRRVRNTGTPRPPMTPPPLPPDLFGQSTP